MPVFVNFDLSKGADAQVVIDLTPPVDVTSWSVEFIVTRRFNASQSGVLFKRSAASGYTAGQSGVEVLDASVGRFGITGPVPEEMSGRDAGNYPFVFKRTDSGGRGSLSEGFALIRPTLLY